MTETETRQFLTKHLGKAGYSVERNESGAINEGYPDTTIGRIKKSMLLELKQARFTTKDHITVAKYQPRQKGKLVTLAFTQLVRILVVTPDKEAFLLSAPYTRFRLDSKCIKWRGKLDADCQLANYLNSWWEDLVR